MCYTHTFEFLFNGQTHNVVVIGYDDEAWEYAIRYVKEDFNITDEKLIEESLTLVDTDYSTN